MGHRAQVKVLIRDLEKQGFEVVRTNGGHWKVTHPDRGGMVILGFSPSRSGQHASIKRLMELGYKP